MAKVLAFSVCSAVILLFLIVSLILRKATKGRANRIFIWLISLIFVSCASDILCQTFPYFFDPGYESFFLKSLLTYIYFLSRNLTAPVYCLFIYASCGIWHEFKSKSLLNVPWTVVTSAFVVLILCNTVFQNIFYLTEDLQYHRGSHIILLYMLNAAIMLYSIGVIILKRKIINPLKCWVFSSLFLFSMAGSLCQMLFPNIMLETFSISFPMLLITLVVQKPEEIINPETGTLNYSAFKEEIKKDFLSGCNVNIVYIRIENFRGIKKQFQSSAVAAMLNNLIKRFYNLCGTDETEVYSISDGFFAVVSTNLKINYFDAVAEGLCLIMKEKQKIGQSEILFDFKIAEVLCPDDLQDFNTVINFNTHFANIITEKNKVVYLKDISQSKDFLIRTNLDDIIKNAITNNKFQMYFQPIYNIKEKKFTSAEALIRLIDDKYGFVSPGLFIPAAEVSGAIHRIGDWVLEDVCRFISQTDFETLGLEYIEINLSVAQAIEEDLAEKYENVLTKYHIRPGQINVEITETAADFNPELFDRNIQKISNMGISFSLDDYGTGYSNIRRVTSLPLDIIKLDKSFVDEWQQDKMNIIIRENVSMLKKMNKLVLVEGVEDEEASDFFKQLKCDYIQGFFYSKPLPEKDFVEFIKKHNLPESVKGEAE